MTGSERIVRQILSRRGLKGEALKKFLQPSLDDLHDPLLLPDIKPAIKRIMEAKRSGQKVVIYGDYDIDGLCATTLLMRAFKEIGINAEAFIPNRFEQGYGLKKAALAELIKKGVKLIITVDCGTTAVEEISWATTQDLDIIVTDHHEPAQELPSRAIAVINPKRMDSTYPCRELSGCGVAFKLVQALQTKTEAIKPGSERWLLDLVAFATVCDAVPLVDENRTLAYFGLKVWPKTRWPGLKALMQTTGIRGNDVTATTLGYIFGPRLNAAGRISHARTALELLGSDSLTNSLGLAGQLEELNQQRRIEQGKIENSALAALELLDDEPVIVLADADWSHGVVGIVASRLMERTAKPVFLLQTLEDGTAKGSARSYGSFSIAAALDYSRELLITGGGHAAAGGLSLKSTDLSLFQQKVIAYHRSLSHGDESHLLKPQIDAELNNIADINLDLIESIARLEPFGQGNPEPVLEILPLDVLQSRRIGRDARHMRLALADEDGRSIEAVMFNTNDMPTKGQQVSVAARVQANDFGGRRRAELVLEGWRVIS